MSVGLGTEQANLRHAVRRAKRQKLFASLARIYASFPETECENCARCCFESPGIFFIEYLHLMEEIGGLPWARAGVAQAARSGRAAVLVG